MGPQNHKSTREAVLWRLEPRSLAPHPAGVLFPICHQGGLSLPRADIPRKGQDFMVPLCTWESQGLGRVRIYSRTDSDRRVPCRLGTGESGLVLG